MSEDESAGTVALSIALEPSTLRAGEPVWLRVTIHNGDAAVLSVPELSSWFECEFDARGPGGELPRTRYGNQQYREVGTRQLGEQRLEPGGDLERRVPFSRLFDATVAGEYRVVVSRELRSGTSEAWIPLRSNELVFRLVE